jgi:hypothetical protein
VIVNVIVNEIVIVIANEIVIVIVIAIVDVVDDDQLPGALKQYL